MDNKYLSTWSNIEDVEDIVRVHIKAFPSSFLSRLGPSFLFVFIKYMVTCKDIHVRILKQGKEIIGYSAISSGNYSLWRGLILKYPLACVYHLAKMIIYGSVKPHEVLNRIRSNGSFVYGTWHLHSIAVLPSYQGKGIGKRLMQIVEEYIHEVYHGSVNQFSLSLTTNKLENSEVIRFYKSIGFAVESSATINDREMLFLIQRYD